MKWDIRAVFAASALALASCQGAGLDSGGMGGMEPPVSQPGSMSNGGMPNGMNGGLGNQMAGPNVGANGQEQLTNPGATLAPNEAQYPIGQGPSGMKCPQVLQYGQGFTCTLAFNIPTPSPGPNGSPGAKKSTPAPTASPTPTPQPSASSDDDNNDDSSDDTPAPTSAPAGTMTMQMEPLPKDVPSMTNPNPLFMHVTPLVAIRLQSNMDFVLNGNASVQYVLPQVQYNGRVFSLQLYNESVQRGKRVDQLIATYGKWNSPQSNTVSFQFTTPKVTVRHSQIWLLAMYGAQLPPGTTPTPSPTPASSSAPSPSASP